MKDGTLRIGLRKATLDRGDIAKAVIAEVVQIASATGEAPADPFRRTLAVPAGAKATQAVEVPPGSYVVTLSPPGGEPQQKGLRVDAGGAEEIIFDIGRSPQAWLSLQTLMGATPLQKERSADLSMNRTLRRHIGNDFEKVETLSPVLVINRLGLSNRATETGGADWEDTTFYDWGVNVAVHATTFNDDYALWRLPASAFGAMPDSSGGEIILSMVALQTPLGIARAMVPVPWRKSDNTYADIEVLFDAKRPIERSPLSVSVVDNESVALLSYLRTGQLALANAVLQDATLSSTIQQRIEDKFQNPLLAAAASYVALATPNAQIDRKVWRPWIKNLCSYFPWMPDGAILEARLLLNEEGVSKRVIEALHRAYLRGPPFFSAGLPHLMTALFRCKGEQRELDRKYRMVAAYAAFVDPHEPFRVEWRPTELEREKAAAPLLAST